MVKAKSGISDGCTLCNRGAMSEQTVILLTLSPRDSFGKKKYSKYPIYIYLTILYVGEAKFVGPNSQV